MLLIDRIIQQIQAKEKKMSFSSYELSQLSESDQKRPYHRTQAQEKNDLIIEVIENGLSISKAAKKLRINNSTAKVIIRKYKQEHFKSKKSEESREAPIENSTIQVKPQIAIPEAHRIVPPLYVLYHPTSTFPQNFIYCYNILWGLYPNSPNQ